MYQDYIKSHIGFSKEIGAPALGPGLLLLEEGSQRGTKKARKNRRKATFEDPSFWQNYPNLQAAIDRGEISREEVQTAAKSITYLGDDMNLSFLACVLRPFTKNGVEVSPDQRVIITEACVNPTSQINMASPAVQMDRSIWSSLARYLCITQPHERTDTLDAFKLIAQQEGVTVVPINLVSQSFSFLVKSTQPPIESSRVAKLSGNITVEAASLLVKDTRTNTTHPLRIIVVYGIRRKWNPEAKEVIEELTRSLT